MAYLGKLKAESANTEGLYEFTATSGQTTFSCSYTIGHAEVFLNGVRLASTDFTATTGTSVVLTVPATLGDNVQIKTQNINGLVNGYSNVEVDAKFVNTVLTGTPTAPTAAAGTNTTQVATTAGVIAQIPASLNATGTAPIYACRAWVNFNGTGTVAIRASGNVSSITDNGVGSYTVNFTTAMVDVNYAPNCSVGDDSYVNASPEMDSLTTISMKIRTIQIEGMSGDNRVPSDRAYIFLAVVR